MKTTPIILLCALIVTSCARTDESAPSATEMDDHVETVDPPAVVVTAFAETEPVSADPEADAADDPAIWFNESDPAKSLILGSDKTLGLDVFDLSGKRLETHEVGRINNIDVRNGMDGEVDLVGGSNRDDKAIDLWTVDKASQRLIYNNQVPTDLNDVYGFCMYKSPLNGAVYAFINSKTGKINQYLLKQSEGLISGELVRTLEVQSQPEGMVADDYTGMLYVGEENRGIHKFEAEPNGNTESTIIEGSTSMNDAIEFDIEGLTIFYKNESEGYLIASSQGNNSYAVFTREGDHDYIGSFTISDGDIDGVSETDGIDVLHSSLGDLYPFGVFICQDGFNYEGDSKVAQNFKMVRWEDIAKAIDLM